MKSYLFFGLLLLSSVAIARPNADELRVCYLFNKDNVVNKGACVVSSGYGAGGVFYYNLDYKGKEYLFEFSSDNERQIYYRDIFYDKITKENEEYVNDDERITCFKHKPYDICFL